MKKRTLKKYNNAGTVDKTGATVANVTNIAGTVIPIATSFLPKNNYTDNQGNVLGSTNSLGADVLNNAATGASLGTMIAPGIGTAIGGALGAGWGAISNGIETNDMIDARNRANIRNNNRSLSNKVLNNNNMFTKQNYNNDNMVFANGGMVNINDDMPNASEEVEGNETAITPDGQHIAFNGPSHEEGGIETNLPEGTFIFSDRLKMGKKTFASLAKPIQNKITKLEENPSKFAKNSKELLTKQLDFLANNQEQIKQEQEMKKNIFAKGGKLKTFPDGGNIETGKKGMMKARIALDSHFGNEAAKRMTEPYPETYTFTGNEPDDFYREPVPNGEQGTHFLSSQGNYVVPYIQKINDKLQFVPNANINSKEAMKFESDDDAKYFANNYKQVAPFARNINYAKGGMVKYDDGGTTPIIVSNPNDPRLKAYNDSSAIYNSYVQAVKGANVNNIDPLFKHIDKSYNKRFKNIEPIGVDSINDYKIDKYKKPVQPYKYNFGKNSIKFQPQESFDNRLPIENPQYIPSNTYQADYEALTKTPQGQFYMNNNVPNTGANIDQARIDYKNIGLNDKNYTEPKTNSFNNIDYNELGQIGASVGSNFAQVNRINNMAKPRTLNNVRLQPGMTNPKYVNLSGQRNAISRVAKSAMDEANRNFGNSSSIQAFKNKARLNELQGLGESYQNQENTNAGIFNQYANQKNEIAAKEALTNAEIDKYNIDAAYGDAASRVSGKNAATAQLGNTIGQVFGNRTAYKNQLDQANILKNSYNPEVINRAIENGELVYKNGKLEPKAYGGKIKKRSLKK